MEWSSWHSQFLFWIRLLLHAVPGGLNALQQEQAYRKRTTQKLFLPLFSLLSLHIKPPWCHRFIAVTKRQASSCPSPVIKQSLYHLGPLFSVGLQHTVEPSDSSQQRVEISRCSCQPVIRSLWARDSWISVGNVADGGQHLLYSQDNWQEH